MCSDIDRAESRCCDAAVNGDRTRDMYGGDATFLLSISHELL
jgi:hypothetical protein